MRPLALVLSLALPLPLSLAAQAPIPPIDEQVAAAVLPLPNDLRAGATVLGFKTAGKLEVLREGKNGMRCLALYVPRPDFHVACYHEGLEPFMARGRELREQGVTAIAAVDSVRFAEVKSGKLKMPPHGAMYSLTGPKTGWDATARTIKGATPLGVVYVPFATQATLGLSEVPSRTGPFIMNAGTAKAHIMIVGSMQ